MAKKLLDEDSRLHMIAKASWLKRIEDWRRAQPGLPTLSEAVRQLVDLGLEAAAKKSARR